MRGRTNMAAGGGGAKMCHVTCTDRAAAMNRYSFFDGTELQTVKWSGATTFEFDMPQGLLCMSFDYKFVPFDVTSGDAEIVEESSQGGAPVDFVTCYYVYGDCALG